MKILGQICPGQTFFLTFSVFKASLVVGGTNAQRVFNGISIPGKVTRSMQGLNHLNLHGSRHPEGDTKLLGA